MADSHSDPIVRKIRDLPPLPLVVQKLLSIVDDDSSSVSDVSKVLSTDQALTAKVLKLVNSSFYGFSRQISTISRAIVILGFSAVRNLALGLSAFEALKELRGPVNWDEFWNHGLVCATSAQALATHMKYEEAEEAFIGGLLHDIGHFVLNITYPEEFSAHFMEPQSNLIDREKECFGMSHCEAGIRLLEHWKLPDSLCRVARFHHTETMVKNGNEPLIPIVMLSDAIACVKGAGYLEMPQLGVLESCPNALDIKLSSFQNIFSEIDRRVRETRVFMNIAEESRRTTGRLEKSEEEMISIVVAGRNEERLEWLRSILSHFGLHVIPMHSLVQKPPEVDHINLVMLDTQYLTEEQLERFGTLLSLRNISPVILTDDGTIPEHLPTSLVYAKVLPFMFTRQDIEALIVEVA